MRSTPACRASCAAPSAAARRGRAKGLAHRRLLVSSSSRSPVSASSNSSSPHGRQLLLARIADAHGDQVVPPAGALEEDFIAAIEKVAEKKDDRTALQHAVEEVQSLAQRRAACCG